MLSLTRAINRIDREERLYKAAVDCYLAAISALEECPLETEPEVSRAYEDALREIRAAISDTRAADELNRSRETLCGVVKTHRERAADFASGKAEDLRAVIAALAEAAQLLGQQQSGQSEKLRQFTNRLQSSAERVTDLAVLRRQIVSHVADLRAIDDTARKETSQTISMLQSQLAEFGRRLESAEQRAGLDGLTGLLNRGEGENRLGRIVKAGSVASAILVDMNGFKRINDSWGHTAGDQVLKTCARILSEQTRASDVVCRWGGDEFLVILRCDGSVAIERAKTLRERLRVPQKIVVLGKIFEIAAGASIGVAELREGETAEDFIARVDAEMYRDKCGKTEMEGALV